jgi:hypothetical protein
MFIKLDGKEYEMKFTYRTIRYLENYYGMGISSIFQKLDMESVDALTTFIWAMLKHHEDWKTKTVDDVAESMDNAIESEELNLLELTKTLEAVISNSMILKQMGKNAEKKPGNAKKGK